MIEMILPFTNAERETIDALRDQRVPEPEIAMLVTVARVTGKAVDTVALTYSVVREQLAATQPVAERA